MAYQVSILTMAALLSSAGAAHAEFNTRKALPLDVALTIAHEAVTTCRAKGFNVSAVVVGSEGETIVALRDDKASPHTLENARRKAYTAKSFRRTTAEYAKDFSAGNPTVQQQTTLPNVIAIAGGIPIKAGDEIIAGVGVSGSPGGNDEPCAQAGLDKVRAELGGP